MQLSFRAAGPLRFAALTRGTNLFGRLGLGLFLGVWFASAAGEAKPIALHPDNPHCFLFRGHLIRSIVYGLLPLALVTAVVLISQGVIQN